MIRLVFICIILIPHMIFGQKFSGSLMSKKNNTPIDFVNIGVIGKNIGFISNENGQFELFIDANYNNDTLKFSRIGFSPLIMKVSDFKKLTNFEIYLEEHITEISSIVVRPKKIMQRELGITASHKHPRIYFTKYYPGNEMGVMIKNKKSLTIESLIINFATCTYDTVFYRINVYKVLGGLQFENILNEPIYIKIPKSDTKEKVVFDLRKNNLIIQGDFLLSLEQVKDLGDGEVSFCTGFLSKTYWRNVSQGNWMIFSSVAPSISVDAKVEK